ncbi:MAG: NAD(P)/FAD-dependent oxidoreductase, partial [Clostridia bacterium]|nr:NAD(P)/FAD-dependent oxidoreductase [Clostridia bacterium]
MTDVIIIGAGPAAVSAALTLRMRGKTVQMLYAGGGALEKAHRVDNYPGMPRMSGEEMLRIFHAQCEEAGVV